VTDISLKDNNKAKTDKSEHEIGRVQEIEAEGSPSLPLLIVDCLIWDDKPKREGLIGLLPAHINELELVE
ncbi:hypothetical protein Tco_1037623, partial [Tanacetum coccineum]